MCRLFAALSPDRRSFEEDLLYFRHLSSVHSDGWGIGWYYRNKPVVSKSSTTALYDPKYLTAARTARSNMVIAHLRKQTRGNVRDVNNHPFTFKDYIFSHNGTISKQLKYLIKDQYQDMRGDTDSEMLLHFLLQHIEGQRPLFGMRKAFRKIQKLNESGQLDATAVNFILTDGKTLYAYRKMYSRPMRLFYRHDENGHESLQISSAPLRTRDWVEMGDGEMLIADVDTLKFRVIRIIH
ncbi:MAG: class II glutamine amidotransferase [Candidatus Altiarchaeota archaeon]|nr:class II glutamine amidotransferase [Candidatus Altiarchaeota archaeon]